MSQVCQCGHVEGFHRYGYVAGVMRDRTPCQHRECDCAGFRAADDQRPDFYIDAAGVECWVTCDPGLGPRGIVQTVERPDGARREITLRDYPPDEPVLLHEVLHRLFQTALPIPFSGPRLISFEAEEMLVGHIERGLWEMGWRLRGGVAG